MEGIEELLPKGCVPGLMELRMKNIWLKADEGTLGVANGGGGKGQGTYPGVVDAQARQERL